jgi:predicted XRE-type DNA-binding protein
MMKTRPTHITKGNVFDDLGFSHSEASALKVKSDLHSAILKEIHRNDYGQHALVTILDEYQPNISNLMKGRISKVSIEKLLTYSDRLKMRASVTIKVAPKRGRKPAVSA